MLKENNLPIENSTRLGKMNMIKFLKSTYRETLFGPPSLESLSEMCHCIAFFKSCTVAFWMTTMAEGVLKNAEQYMYTLHIIIEPSNK